ncbi:MAG TPA: response regulator [Alphaproteobacteria bacterium]|jgi:FixJ family two-component response regulator|nr:response regulator [Alphaproteobacteria bacterium]
MTVTENVYIVDDDEAMRDSLAAFFTAKGFRVVTFASAEEFLDAGAMAEPACVIVDLQLPGMSGLALQAELLRRHRLIPVIVLTGQGDIPKAVTAVKAGAVDFFAKPFEPVALLGAVRNGLDRDGQNRRNAAEAAEIRRRLAQLSPRESEVLKLISEGHPSKIIARELNISVRTVDVHRCNILEKLHCNNATALVALVLRAKS